MHDQKAELITSELLSSQKTRLAKNLKKKSYWVHESDPKKQVTIDPQRTMKDVVRKLEETLNERYSDPHFKRLSDLVREELFKETRYGWKLLKLEEISVNKKVYTSQGEQRKANLQKKSYWIHKDYPNETFEFVGPFKKAQDLVLELGKAINKNYSTTEFKHIIPLIKNESYDIIRCGWRLIKLEKI